jgi:hypothetical protein
MPPDVYVGRALVEAILSRDAELGEAVAVA